MPEETGVNDELWALIVALATAWGARLSPWRGRHRRGERAAERMVFGAPLH